jgi:hypothetical protein
MSPKQTCLEHVLVVGAVAVAVLTGVQVKFQCSVLGVEGMEEKSEVLPPKAVGERARVQVEFQHSLLRWEGVEGVEGAGLLVRVEMLTVAAGRDPEVCPATVPIAGGSSL